MNTTTGEGTCVLTDLRCEQSQGYAPGSFPGCAWFRQCCRHRTSPEQHLQELVRPSLLQQHLPQELRTHLGERATGPMVVDLPADYKRGMEGLLAEELQTQKMRYTLALKEKLVEQTALEAQADGVVIEASADAKLILVAGQPLKQPIVQYGPFVMNTKEEIYQALADFRDGRLGESA